MPQGWSLPGYIEVAELGAGAQGQVVLARHESGGIPVAIKYLAPALLEDVTARNSFRSEAEILRRVTNPHVARLLYYVEWTTGAAIIMEAVPGRSLRRVLDERKKALAPEAALAVLKGSLLGMAGAHNAGVIHRDYKPANVLVQDDGQSKLVDFGIAVLAGQGDKSGTPAYMAPEQWRGQPATPATDLYAATCVFIECVTGRKPFQAANISELRTAHIETMPSLDLVPEELHALVRRGMAKNPSERLWDAGEFAAQLEEVAVRTYGPDWERRGVIALGAVAALVGTAVPLSMLGGALLAPGISATGGGGTGVGALATGATGQASAVHAQGAATADVAAKGVGSSSKGVLAKVGGGKGAAGIGTGAAGAVAIGWLFWPTGPNVGGESRGAIHASFAQPGVLLSQPFMPASDTPYMDLRMTVTPARAKPGTTLQVTTHFKARTPSGANYLADGNRQCFGPNSDHSTTKPYEYSLGLSATQLGIKGPIYLALYKTPPADPDKLPQDADATALPVKVETVRESQPFDQSECAYLSDWVKKRVLVLPGPDLLPPGKYMVAPAAPVKITNTVRDGKPIAPEAAGAVTEGRLPVLEVLEDG
ncbi:serine/threonine-protein kinase [Spirillospora sp. NPDC052242]